MVKKCPLVQGECMEHGCHWYTHLMGANPQTGAAIDEFGCAVSMLPMLLIENAKHAREGVARVDQVRELVTQVVRSNVLRAPTDELKRLTGL
jgi:hypothetical protein